MKNREERITPREIFKIVLEIDFSITSETLLGVL